MDDFGSGYSSLNMLKDIAVDIIKIDMGFLRREENPRHSESILEAIVSMARILKLRVIAEGAETKEQVDFLKNVGCDYAQGYFFYRPMPIEDLRAVLGDGSVVDPRGVLSTQMDAIDLSTMLSRDEISHSVLERILGGLAIYAVYDDHFELLQVSNAYYRVTGCNPVDLKERQACIWQQIHPDDLPLVLERFDEAEQHPIDGAEYVVRRYRLSGGAHVDQGAALLLEQAGGAPPVLRQHRRRDGAASAGVAEAAADALRALRTSHAQAHHQAKTRRAGLLQAAARLHTPRPTVRCIM